MNDPRQPEATAPHVPASGPSDDNTPADVPAPEGAPAAVTGPPGERYQFGPELARGGMGVVYRAHDLPFDREVAVKVLGPGLAGTEAARRFFEEARITGQLEHPSIPPVHDLGTLSDGRPFLAMKLIRGKTLAKELQERGSPGAELDRFAGIFERVCEAMAFAHARGVIHRDLKPSNVMVGAFGEVQVMDWGLAKSGVRNPEAGVSRRDSTAPPREGTETVAGQVMGTPAYMPPEQARGQTDRIGPWSDVFALGGILCAILTGEPPYTAPDGRNVLRKAEDADLTGALARLSAATAELAEMEEAVEAGPLIELARRCLCPNPQQRPAHAGEVLVMVRSARSKVQTYRRNREIDRAVAGVEAATRSAMRYSVATNAGCGLRLLMLAAGIFVIVFLVYVRFVVR